MPPPDPPIVVKRCSKRHAHAQHTWWSRRQKRYYRCYGRQ